MTTDALTLTVLTVLVVYGLCLALCDLVSWLLTRPEREPEIVAFDITMDSLRGWKVPPRPPAKR